jgi:glucose-6-phosphate isomerase
MGIKNKSKVKAYARFLYEMKKVVLDRQWLKTAPDFAVYRVWRGLKEKGELRYDITEITPKMLGKEFPKTQGHDHFLNCPELITVIQGKALFLYQRRRGKKIVDVFCILAKKGDSLIAPAGYAHFTINPSGKKLRFYNWISKKNSNKYGFVEKMKGACYYYTKSGWLKNRNYKNVPKLRFKKPLKKIPKNLDFLLCQSVK